MAEVYNGGSGSTPGTSTVGFQGVIAPEIKPGECWSPLGVQKSGVTAGVNDYMTLVEKGAIKALENKSST